MVALGHPLEHDLIIAPHGIGHSRSLQKPTKTIQNKKYLLHSKSDVDFEKKLHSNHQILETERDKIELKSHEYFLYLEDVIRISDELGFEIVNLYGNYNFEIFNEFSEEMIFICKKKHG